MAVIATIGWVVAQLYLFAMIARMIIELVMAFARSWRPRGVMLVVAETTFTLTDPPIRLVRRLIPPVRLGGVRIDVGFVVVIVVLSLIVTTLRVVAVSS
jgi:YggT family protein